MNRLSINLNELGKGAAIQVNSISGVFACGMMVRFGYEKYFS